MTPHRECFYDYEKYDGGVVFLGNDSIAKITRRRRVKFLLKDGSVKTILGVLHVPYLARSLISIRKMSDTCVHIVFEKDK
jgi:hypothetical protein